MAIKKSSSSKHHMDEVFALPGESQLLAGREKEMDKVLLSISPQFHICCISGPPAVGKSALAIEAVRRARCGNFDIAQAQSAWKVVYVDIRQIDTVNKIVDTLLCEFELNYSSREFPKQSSDCRKLLFKIVRESKDLCIVIDNADLALQPSTRHDFIALLKYIMHAGQQEFTLIVTSCYRLDNVIWGDRKIQSVVLKPLEEEPACEILKSVCRPDRWPNERDMQMISQDICQGIPELLWHVGKQFENIGFSPSSRVGMLLEDPTSCLRRLCQDFGLRHFKSTLESLPRRELTYLHALSLFEGFFSEENGTYVVGMGNGVRKFGSEVIDSLDNYSMVLEAAPHQYHLVKILREYLRWEHEPPDANFQSAAEKNYCHIWLRKLHYVLKKTYCKNSRKALKQVQAMIKDVKHALRMIEPCSKTSDALYSCYIAVATGNESLLRVCLTLSERTEFYSACIKESTRRDRTDVQGQLNLRLAEAFLDSNNIEKAQESLKCLTPEEACKVVSLPRNLQLQYEIIQGRIDIEKGNSRKAVESLNQALAVESVGKKDPEFGNFLLVLSDAYCDLREYQNVYLRLIEAYTWCSERFGSEREKNHPDTCVVLFRLGHCLFCQKRYDESLQWLSNAVGMLKELHCDHLCIAAALYQLSMCRLAVFDLNCPEARDDLEHIVVLLEGESSFKTVPLWILAKQAIAKLLTLEGRKLIDGGIHSEKGQTLLNKAKEHFADLLDENVEGISREMIKENDQFHLLADAVRPGSDLRFNMYCFQTFRSVVCPKPLDLTNIDSDSDSDSPQTSAPSARTPSTRPATDGPSVQFTSTPMTVSKHHQLYSAESTFSPGSSATLLICPVPLRTLSAKTEFGLTCCPSHPSRKLSRCAGSLASFSSVESDAVSDISTSTDLPITSDDSSGVRIANHDSVPTMSKESY